MRNWPLRSLFSRCSAALPILAALAFCSCVLPRTGQAFDLAAAAPKWQGELASRAKSSPGAAPAQADNRGSWSIFHKDGKSTVSIYYPQMDNDRIDDELAHWADVRLRTFVAGVSALGEGNSRYSMRVEYSISQASRRFASVLFRIATETGGLRPDLGLAAFTYDLEDGRTLSYGDIFADPSGLLLFLSGYCRQDLSQRLDRSEHERIQRGTGPSDANFAYFTLRPDGIEVFFPPYQVASSSLGEQSVVVPLEKLGPYGPDPSIWRIAGKKR